MKIDERILTKACIIGAVFGILAIYFLASSEPSLKIRIGEITEKHTGKKIEVNGVINSPSFNNGNYFFSLSDDAEIRAVVFESDIRKNDMDIEKIKEGEKVSIEGIVQLYRSDLKIIVKRIS